MSKSLQPMDSERREYFRIDDNLSVDLRRVSSEEISAGLERMETSDEGSFTVISSLAAITAQMTVHMRRIENEMPDVAAYLKGMDRKLEVIGRTLIAQDSAAISTQAQSVNLSAGGVCLEVDEYFEANTKVEVRLLLFPSMTGVVTFGEVVDSVEQPSGGVYRVRIEFTHIREQDRDLLIRHILRRQGDELRARKQEEE